MVNKENQKKPESRLRDCFVCKGNGTIQLQFETVCSNCHGIGKVPSVLELIKEDQRLIKLIDEIEFED